MKTRMRREMIVKVKLESTINFMRNWVEGDRATVDLPFTGVPGFTNVIELPENPSALDFWCLYVTDRDFETVATETNRYASEYLENNAANIIHNKQFHLTFTTISIIVIHCDIFTCVTCDIGRTGLAPEIVAVASWDVRQSLKHRN